MKQNLLFVLCLFTILPLFSQQRFPAGMLFDEEAYAATPLQEAVPGLRMASAHSLKPYSPYAQDQGSYNNCVGWSVAYAARTIVLAQKQGWKDRSYITQYAFSPSFTYKLVSKDNTCASAISIEHALYEMRQQGAIFMREVPDGCIRRIPYRSLQRAQTYRIDSYQRLFYKNAPQRDRIQSVKQALGQGQPVILGMRCTPSFEHADGQPVWRPRESSRTRNYYGHALTVVGYDDNRYGGAFEVMNSWGTKWGNKGFIWIRYEDFTAFSKYAFVPVMEE